MTKVTSFDKGVMYSIDIKITKLSNEDVEKIVKDVGGDYTQLLCDILDRYECQIVDNDQSPRKSMAKLEERHKNQAVKFPVSFGKCLRDYLTKDMGMIKKKLANLLIKNKIKNTMVINTGMPSGTDDVKKSKTVFFTVRCYLE